MKKIPHGSKVVNIMIGELDVLDRMIGAFVRMKVRQPRERLHLSFIFISSIDQQTQEFIFKIDVYFIMIGMPDVLNRMIGAFVRLKVRLLE